MKIASGKYYGGKLQVPAQNEGVLIYPPAERFDDVLAGNMRHREEPYLFEGQLEDYDFQGCRFRALVDQSREEMLLAAVAYTSSYRNLSSDHAHWRSSDPLIFAGHQPDLFHPGVWAKNFAMGTFAASQGGVAINLLIDADVPKSTSLKVPTGSPEVPALEKIALDNVPIAVPYEEWEIMDEDLFRSFGSRVAAAIKPLVADPSIGMYWQKVLERSRSERHVGFCLAQARHQLEGEWGLRTLELPQSHCCETEAFRWFTAHMFAQLPRLHEIYNASVTQYRQDHHLRSATHPVPDLIEENGWLEAPYWIWDAENPRRRRLICRPCGDELLLADGAGLEIPLSLTPDGDAGTAVSQLADISKRGIRIRPRALMTTMFTRLLCSDMFVHGVGGGKYDQVTDSIMHQFFGINPPDYVVLSGTLKLSVSQSRPLTSSLRSIKRELRDLKFNPDRFLRRAFTDVESKKWWDWIENKRRWVHTPKNIENSHTRHREISRSNEELQSFVAERSQQLYSQQEKIMAQLRADTILSARDYAFCLFPQSQLMHYMLDILPKAL